MNSAKENPSFLVFLIVSVFSTNVFGTVYYVSKTGNDFNTCAQARNKAFPKLTISAGIKCLSSGDTLYIRSGTYYEAINEYKVSIPSGTSWQSPVTIAGYPGEKIILQPCTGETEVLRLMGYTAGTQYVVFDNLTLDGINNIANIVKITYTGNNPNHCSNHIRIKNCEIKNARHNGIYVDSQSGNNEFINLKIHDNGSSDFDHGLYITGNNNLIKKCDIYQNAGWGIHIYNELSTNAARNNIICYNSIHQNAKVGNRGFGIIISSGANNVAYNNLIWGNNGGIQIDYNAKNTMIYNNTICSNNGKKNLENGIKIGTGSINAKVVNNIVWNHVASNIFDAGINSSFITNLTTKPPLFVNSINCDFHLRYQSPATNAGKNLAPTVIDDYDGIARPQGIAYDIGAFEFTASKNSLIRH